MTKKDDKPLALFNLITGFCAVIAFAMMLYTSMQLFLHGLDKIPNVWQYDLMMLGGSFAWFLVVFIMSMGDSKRP